MHSVVASVIQCLFMILFLGASAVHAQRPPAQPEIPVANFNQIVQTPEGDVKVEHFGAVFDQAEEEELVRLVEMQMQAASESGAPTEVYAQSLDFVESEAAQKAEAQLQSEPSRGERILSKIRMRAKQAGSKIKGFAQRSVVQPLSGLLKHTPRAPKLSNIKIVGKSVDKITTLLTISRFTIPGVLSFVGLSITTDIPAQLLIPYAASVFTASTIFALNAKRVNDFQANARVWASDRKRVFEAYNAGKSPKELVWINPDNFLPREEYLQKQEEFVKLMTEGDGNTPPVRVKDRALGKGATRPMNREEALKLFSVSEHIYSKAGHFKNFTHGMVNFLGLEYLFAYMFIGVYYEALNLDAITGSAFSLRAFLLGGLATTATQGLVEQALTKVRSVAKKAYGWSEQQIHHYFIRVSALASITSVSAYAILDAAPALAVLGWTQLTLLGVYGGALYKRTVLHEKQITESMKQGQCENILNGTAGAISQELASESDAA